MKIYTIKVNGEIFHGSALEKKLHDRHPDFSRNLSSGTFLSFFSQFQETHVSRYTRHALNFVSFQRHRSFITETVEFIRTLYRPKFSIELSRSAYVHTYGFSLSLSLSIVHTYIYTYIYMELICDVNGSGTLISTIDEVLM